MAKRENPNMRELVLYDEESGEESVVGAVEIGPDNSLRLLKSAKDKREFLTERIEEMNAKTAIHPEAPPSDGSPKFPNMSRVVQRGDIDFLMALNDYWEKHYNLSLR